VIVKPFPVINSRKKVAVIFNTLLQLIARRFAFLPGFTLLFHPAVLGGKGTEGAGCLAIFRRSLMVPFGVP
jgi:hypothetical protein